MQAKAKEIVRTTIDLPAALNAKLIAEAGKSKRSRHSQMLIALEKFFDSRGGHGKKEQSK